MSWTKVSERLPPENEQVLIHDDRQSRMRVGWYIKGRWYIEDTRGGRPSEISGVTHWAWMLDSQINDVDDDD